MNVVCVGKKMGQHGKWGVEIGQHGKWGVEIGNIVNRVFSIKTTS